MNKERALEYLKQFEDKNISKEDWINNLIDEISISESGPIYTTCLTVKSILPVARMIKQTKEIPDDYSTYSFYREKLVEVLEWLDAQADYEYFTKFEYHKDTKTFHCKKCGAKVGWIDNIGKTLWSSEAEGDEEKGLCYSCCCEKNRNEI